MSRRILIATVCIALLSLLTGCWNRRELNTLAIQLGTGIDKVGDQYRISVQVVDPGQVAAARSVSPERSPVVMYKSTASTLLSAYRSLTETSPRKIYGAHIRVLILGESLARDGISKVLDLLSRDAEIRTDFYIMIARGTTAEKILKVLTPLEKIPANKLFSSLDVSEKVWAPTTTFTLDQLISQMVVAGQNPVLTGIKIKGDPDKGESQINVKEIDPPARLSLSGLAVFKGPRMVGWLDQAESKGYNIIMDNVKSSAANISCPDGGNIALEIMRSKTKVKGKVVNGEPRILVHVKTEANVGEVNCTIDMNDPETIKWLEKEGARTGIGLMEKSVQTAQSRYSSDIFGFGQAIYRSHPKYWESIQKEWTERFKRLQVDYKVDYIVRKIGTTDNSFIQDVKG
ncbi:Ger(x)C family spore germination protein [Cohnella cholangitidis]|uniref:Ger(X)C family spore germination protein n=1 Tax=Cohnella cholangitidis TaxID=2598458 RepID=A0A7G5C1N9_9BACL|nr:Ger(x)C family spore germination protein [Cohnella cholangitidis]QMV43123.1 Ger(x)C family spore germination protein [Cohnella cholangitidis]